MSLPQAQRAQSQLQKAEAFHALHQGDKAFIIPNPWDKGTAYLLSKMGFKALATTSAGAAFFQGKQDNTLGREVIMSNVKDIVGASPLPVSADLENGFGDTPELVAETIRIAIDYGLAGGSIEDANNLSDVPIYSLELAADRIRAAAEAVKNSGIPFVLTGRAENFLFGNRDIKDTIKRLQSYQEAGADVLYAPGLTTADEISAVVSSVDRPVNVVMGLQGANLSLEALSALGVRRVSVGSALSRAALGAFLTASREMLEHGTFSFAEDAIPYGDISSMLCNDAPKSP